MVHVYRLFALSFALASAFAPFVWAKDGAAGAVITTYGTSLTAGGAWQVELKAKLQACSSGPVEVLNRGKNAATSKWGLSSVQDVTADRPSYVIVEFAINDAARRIGTSLQQAEMNTKLIISAIQEKLPDTKVFLMTTNPTWGYQAGQRPNLDKYYDMYRSIAKSGTVGLIDTTKSWIKLTFEDIKDGLHPSKAAFNMVLLPIVFDALSPEICDK